MGEDEAIRKVVPAFHLNWSQTNALNNFKDVPVLLNCTTSEFYTLCKGSGTKQWKQ